MSLNPFPPLRRGFGAFWRALDATRRAVINLIFLLIVIAILIAIFGGGAKPLAEKTTLVLDLQGPLVEETPGGVREAVLANVSGEVKKNVQLRDVLAVLDTAAKDKNIGSMVILLDELQGGGLASLREVAAGVERFRATGKKVTAWGSSYNQRQYLVAAKADEVFLHPMGGVMLEGFGRYRNYYRDALDKVGVTVNLLKVGTYKSAAEPFIANGPSEAAAEADRYLNNGLWTTYTTDVEKARKLPAGAIMQSIDALPALMTAAGGDLGKLSLDAKLVDGLKTRDELRQFMMARGAKNTEGTNFRQVNYADYLARLRPVHIGDAVGVVIASGEIGDGIAAPGSIGGLSTSRLIRQAREDKSIKAVVLRVDSPGGSAFGSELIRRELELTRAAGKPVVVSMGNVAASGGYWISTSSDEVIADAATITGSIGVFAILPTADKVVEKLGIHTAGSPTTWLADAGNPLRPLDPRFAQVIQGSINHVYGDFLNLAAKARKTTPEKIDEVAQGRVWTGLQAKERNLVDRIGSYGDALASAAKRANLGADYRVTYLEQETSNVDRLIGMFGSKAMASLGLGEHVKLGLATTGLPADAALGMAQELSWLSGITREHKPFMAFTHCLCEVPLGSK
ncbi:signal peptide peptidase SppA [Janthinobacterium lividum]|uniref:Signal peptide peptidase SppA n=1 Tax=Janthinobacterium lividum TaxID=29581 RepID=A0ABU0XQ88_9BURK|nr:signal peptide peptidase SppA [Janthinobacterium lividum]MDQ4625696.1 signal peptide peptidase SppA [Janthinobacterium lividum]MDQ4672701.1 signal peptide peptidase SppA [Janthinobacterium lividum]MDQ4683429.1 signal peptide peptidase SppA [Janthinobacterium lividum]